MAINMQDILAKLEAKNTVEEQYQEKIAENVLDTTDIQPETLNLNEIDYVKLAQLCDEIGRVIARGYFDELANQ